MQLTGREAVLTLASGGITTHTGGGAITIIADDVDFHSGDNRVSGTGALTLKANALAQGYRVGAAAQSTFGRDFSNNGDTGYFEFSMSDLSALANGFTEIRLGHQSAAAVWMQIGDVEDKEVGQFDFSARLDDTMHFVADRYEIVGDVQSTETLYFSGRTMEVLSKNAKDTEGPPDSGIYGPTVHINLTEQIVVSGWIRAASLVDITVLGSTGVGALVRYGDNDFNGFTADAGSQIYSENAGSLVSISTTHSIISGTGISARGAGSTVHMKAGTHLTLLQGSAVSVEGNDADVILESTSYLHLNSGSAVLAGATFDNSGETPVPVATGTGATLTIRTGGELTLDGSVTANGTTVLDAGSSNGDHAEYFDRINGSNLPRPPTRDSCRPSSRT
ncbi:hypothetical protein HK414_16050 [Ramlibacter terrae]|uniref:Uncharacterized protein n=1 Tax=Ramlibacter terrae TaxID=2732511 RepID=A0ABX6P3L2_9BURK|nr:hypothetical protein HK414_16050 [Ramlibacter terrae]